MRRARCANADKTGRRAKSVVSVGDSESDLTRYEVRARSVLSPASRLPLDERCSTSARTPRSRRSAVIRTGAASAFHQASASPMADQPSTRTTAPGNARRHSIPHDRLPQSNVFLDNPAAGAGSDPIVADASISFLVPYPRTRRLPFKAGASSLVSQSFVSPRRCELSLFRARRPANPERRLTRYVARVLPSGPSSVTRACVELTLP